MQKLLFLIPCVHAGVVMPTKEIVSGVHMPLVSIGTWVDGSTKKKEDPQVIVKNWLELGFRGIDSAWNYFDQDKIAEVISDSGISRKDLFLTSKIFVCEPLSARKMLEDDLRELKTDYIDLMLIHTNVGLPGGCAATWKVLEEYHNKGKLRAIGVSNWGVSDLQPVLKHATVPIAVNQVEYNLFRHNEKTIAFCDSHNITVEAWSPLGGANGITGHSVFKDETVLSVAAAHNVSAAQVALKFIVQRGHLVAVMSSNQKHQANDADLFGFELTADEMETLMNLQHATNASTILV